MLKQQPVIHGRAAATKTEQPHTEHKVIGISLIPSDPIGNQWTLKKRTLRKAI